LVHEKPAEAGSFLRVRAPTDAAQIFNLLYRKFVTSEARHRGGHSADWTIGDTTD
jgi:hypothetical protein